MLETTAKYFRDSCRIFNILFFSNLMFLERWAWKALAFIKAYPIVMWFDMDFFNHALINFNYLSFFSTDLIKFCLASLRCSLQIMFLIITNLKSFKDFLKLAIPM